MRRTFVGGCLWLLLAGCNSGPSGPPGYIPTNPMAGPQPIANPLFLPGVDKDFLFDQTVDVVDDYFRIDRQERPRQIGDLVAEGHIETFPETAATIFEPWRYDSVTLADRWESTLQSERRRASLRIVQGQGGYFVEVAVIEELEDVRNPDKPTAGEHTFRPEKSSDRYVDAPLHPKAPTGWFPLRRDAHLEQEMLAGIQERIRTRVPLVPINPQPAFGPPPVPVTPAPSPSAPPSATLTPLGR